MDTNLDIRKILGSFTDEERFRVAAAVSLGANTLDKIAALTGFEKSVIMKALVKLEGAGLVEKKESGYVFNIAVLQALNRELSKNTPKKPALTGLARFFKDGKLITYPKDYDDRLLVLNHLAGLFEFNRKYPEKEVNEILKKVNADYASLRRYLIDHDFLKRDRITDKDGHTVTIYRRVER